MEILSIVTQELGPAHDRVKRPAAKPQHQAEAAS